MIKKTLLALAFLAALAVPAFAQESEISGGGGGVSTAGGSGTAGVIPAFVSATSLEDSKMTTSGGSKGTWTLHDDGGTGITSLTIKEGAAQASSGSFTPPLRVLNNDGTQVFMVTPQGNLNTVGVASLGWVSNTDQRFNLSAVFGLAFRDTNSAPNQGIHWNGSTYSAMDIGIIRSAPGILAVTDGSTGQGGIGLSDAATNTVSDALILRHATTDAGFGQNGFGTGLLFQGENDAGTMHDMASIDAVYTDATNGSEDTRFEFRVLEAGAETRVASISRTGGLPKIMLYRVDDSTNGEWLEIKGGTGSAQFTIQATSNGTGTNRGIDIVASGGAGLTLQGGGSDGIRFTEPGVAHRWQIPTGTGHFVPVTTNTYDIGTSSAFVRNAYVSTSIQGTRTQAITDNAAAATFVTIAVPTSNTTVGGRIFYTITAIDAGTATQIKTGTYSFGLSNIGGTVTGAGTDVLEHSQLSTGTLAPTFSVNISGTNAQFQLVLDTSLDAGAETLKIEYRVQIDSGTATVTPAT